MTLPVGGAAKPDRLNRVIVASGSFRPYCRGEQPMTLLNAVLKAASDVKSSEGAIVEIGYFTVSSRAPASNMRAV